MYIVIYNIVQWHTIISLDFVDFIISWCLMSQLTNRLLVSAVKFQLHGPAGCPEGAM